MKRLIRVEALKPSSDDLVVRGGFWIGPCNGFYNGRFYGKRTGILLWKRCFNVGSWHITTWWEEDL